VTVALHLSKKIDDPGLYEKAIDVCVDVLNRAKDLQSASLYWLMDILYNEGISDENVIKTCIERCESAARYNEDGHHVSSQIPDGITDELARQYLKRKALWMKRLDAAISTVSEFERMAALSLRTYAHWKNQPVSFQSVSVAAQFLEDAVFALKEADTTDDVIEPLHKELLHLQARSAAELRASSGLSREDVGLSALYNATREEYKGISLLIRLGRLLSLQPPTENEFRAQLDDPREALGRLISQRRIAHDGRTIGQRDAYEPDDTQSSDAYADVVDRMAQWQRRFACSVLAPALAGLCLVDDDARWIRATLELSEFVPRDHVEMFSRGILAGFHGDWILPLHLLPPQIENSLRRWLQRVGLVTSNLSKADQHEQDIKNLLDREEVQSLIGSDVVLDLRASLVHRFGSNLRNLMAHGLLSDQEIATPDVTYLWWMALRLSLLWPSVESVREDAGITE